jgi:uncharacterized protein (DUF433 family)
MAGDALGMRGTRIPVHLIVELVAQGSKPAELIEGYPRLTDEMIRLAPVYAAAYPLRRLNFSLPTTGKSRIIHTFWKRR